MNERSHVGFGDAIATVCIPRNNSSLNTTCSINRHFLSEYLVFTFLSEYLVFSAFFCRNILFSQSIHYRRGSKFSILTIFIDMSKNYDSLFKKDNDFRHFRKISTLPISQNRFRFRNQNPR